MHRKVSNLKEDVGAFQFCKREQSKSLMGRPTKLLGKNDSPDVGFDGSQKFRLFYAQHDKRTFTRSLSGKGIL